MKKLLRFVFVLAMLSGAVLYGQGSWLDATSLVGNGNLLITDMEIDSNGDAYLIGWFDTNIISASGSITCNGFYDIFFLKINADGTHAWLKKFGGKMVDLPGGVEIGPDQTIYISGTLNGVQDGGSVVFDDSTFSTNRADGFLANYNPDGTRNWVKTAAGGPGNQRIEVMGRNNDRIFVSGMAVNNVIYNPDSDNYSQSYSGRFTHIATFDLNGNFIDNTTIGFKNWCFPRAVAGTTDGWVMAGDFRDSVFLDIGSIHSPSSGTNTDIFLFKVNQDLEGQWLRRTSSTLEGENIPYSVRFDGADNIYVAGKTGSWDMAIDSTETEAVNVIRVSGGDEGFVFNYGNSTGDLNWYSIDGSFRKDVYYDLIIQDDHLMVTGLLSGDFYFKNDTILNPNSEEVAVIEYDLDGEIIHARVAHSEPTHGEDQGFRLSEDPEGNVVVAGTFSSEIINFEDIQDSHPDTAAFNIFIATFGEKKDGALSTSAKDLQCNKDFSGELVINASGGFTDMYYGYMYEVMLDNGDSVRHVKLRESPGTIGGLPAGDYLITVHDNASQLIGSSTESISEPDSIQYSYAVVHPDCYDALTGSITIDAPTGGVTPFKYSINGGLDFEPGRTFNELAAGSYSIVIKDINGCTTMAVDTTLESPEDILYEFEVVNDSLRCYGDSIAEFHIKNVTGGSGSYMYSINGGTDYQADTFFLKLTAGDYSLLITDDNGCTSATTDSSIYSPGEILVNYTVVQPPCHGDSGSIEFMGATGGYGGYSYSITETPAFSKDTIYESLPGGQYLIRVSDDSLCLSMPIDTMLTEPDSLVLVSVATENFKDGMAGSIEVVVSGGTAPYVYTILPDSTEQESGTFNFDADELGTYLVQIDDANLCGPVKTDSITIVDATGIAGYSFPEASVYPNPASNRITIEMPVEGSRCRIEVLSMQGQVVMQQERAANGGLLHTELELSHLARGMYMLRIDNKMLRSGLVLH